MILNGHPWFVGTDRRVQDILGWAYTCVLDLAARDGAQRTPISGGGED
jgi:hypothetical protein